MPHLLQIATMNGAILFVAAFTLASCEAEPEQAAPPPPLVEITTLRAEALPNIVDLPGRIEATRTAEVRARTDGIVGRRLYKEGTDVAEGTPLFAIDPRQYAAQVKQAQATLQRAIAARTNAASVVTRYKPLIEDRSVSGQEYDAALSDLRQAEAQVAEGRAALAQSQLQLSFTTIRAPIAGRAGRAEVTEGALVSGSQATLMTRIDQLSPVYAVFTQSNSAILDTIAQINSGAVKLRNLAGIEVRLILENGAQYGPVGHLDFADQAVDPQTGSQTIRAVFPNHESTLSPGQFVRGRLQVGTVRDALALPQRAVQFQGAQTNVSVVGADGNVVVKPVQLGAQIGKRWIIQSGLKAGERVIVDGWQKAPAGRQVRVRSVDRNAKPRTIPQASR